MKLCIRGLLFVGALLSVATLLSAATLEKQGKDWLAQYKDPAQVNVSGTWGSDLGVLQLDQAKDGRDVTGSGGGFELNGVVSGRTLYLLFSKNGTIGFCAEVTANSDTNLMGEYQYRLSHLRFGAGSGVCQTKGFRLNMTKR